MAFPDSSSVLDKFQSATCFFLQELGVFQRPLTLILMQKYRDTNGRRIVIQIGGLHATFCPEEGILLQKYRDRNGRCIMILFKSIRVRGRCHPAARTEWSRSYKVTNRHPSLPWNFATHRFLNPSAFPDVYPLLRAACLQTTRGSHPQPRDSKIARRMTPTKGRFHPKNVVTNWAGEGLVLQTCANGRGVFGSQPSGDLRNVPQRSRSLCGGTTEPCSAGARP